MQPTRTGIAIGAWLAAVALITTVFMGIPDAFADKAQADGIFKKMTDYLTQQQEISFKFDTNLQVVTKERQKLTLSSSSSVTMVRPNKIRATRWGGFANIEMYFDGTTVSLVDKERNQYAQVEIPGTVDNLIDQLRTKYGATLPAADLLLSNFHGEFSVRVQDIKDLGSGVIRGQECDHVAYRLKEVDVEAWISQSKQPYPCRISIASKKTAASPEYTIDISDWKTGKDVEMVDFTFTPPPGAKKVEPRQLVDFDELPGFFRN